MTDDPKWVTEMRKFTKEDFERMKAALQKIDVRPRDPEKFHGEGWINGEWVKF